MAASIQLSAPRGILISRLAASFQALRETVAQRISFQHTVNDLSKLDRRQLADLGLHRSGIRQAAHEAIYHQQP